MLAKVQKTKKITGKIFFSRGINHLISKANRLCSESLCFLYVSSGNMWCRKVYQQLSFEWIWGWCFLKYRYGSCGRNAFWAGWDEWTMEGSSYWPNEKQKTTFCCPDEKTKRFFDLPSVFESTKGCQVCGRNDISVIELDSPKFSYLKFSSIEKNLQTNIQLFAISYRQNSN